MSKLKNEKVVVVTGASSGIGFAAANLFAANNYRTFGLSRRKVEGANFTQIQMDVTDEKSVQSAIAQIVEQTGRIDILFNNAGFALVGATEESSIEQVKSMFDTNFFGAVRVANAVLPVMRKQKSGRILHTSSIVGLIPVPFMGYYSASKHALEAYSEALDHEVKSFGITSVLIEPSFMKTAINSQELRVDHPLSDYQATRKRMDQAVTAGVEKSPEPLLVAQKVLQVAELANPGLRYLVGQDAKFLATVRKILPNKMFGKMIRSTFRLDK